MAATAWSEKEDDLSPGVGTVVLSSVNWFGKLYWADTLWLFEAME